MSQQNAANQVGKLSFEGDKGAWGSKVIAAVLTLALVGWMGSGYFLETPQEDASEAEASTQLSAVTVAVRPSQAADVDLVLRAEGQSEPDRSGLVSTESSGQVSSVAVVRGDFVTAGQELGRVDATTITAQLTQAQTQLDQAQRELDNALALQDRGLATEDRVTNSRAVLAAAEAAVTAAEEQLENTIIHAPFAGRLNELTLDEGEFVDAGDVVAEVLDNDPLTVVVQIPQQALSRVFVGQPAQVLFITGDERQGEVSFIGGNADEQTRTFRVEIAVENPESAMPAGLSARVHLPTGQARGHFISPAILSLATDGTLGVKTVDQDNRVAFSEVSIVRAQTDGVWVAGLPETVNIITVGQGFVQEGDLVDPQIEASNFLSEVTQ